MTTPQEAPGVVEAVARAIGAYVRGSSFASDEDRRLAAVVLAALPFTAEQLGAIDAAIEAWEHRPMMDRERGALCELRPILAEIVAAKGEAKGTQDAEVR